MTKKKTTKKATLLSPEKYIQKKARALPLKECLVMEGWESLGISNVIVARQHMSGNITVGVYMVDTYCLGVKDTLYRFNVSEEDYEELKSMFATKAAFKQVSYELVHNFILGAVAYAEELGISPHKDFAITEMILEEDDENITLMEMEFGFEGKPLLMVDTMLEASKYVKILEQNIPGGYEVYVDELNKDEEYQDLFNESYTYEQPDYPTELTLTHIELKELYLKKNEKGLSESTLKSILSLPRESLINDLIQMLYVEMGKIQKGITKEYKNLSPVIHILLLLGELKAEQSLPVLLEMLRQDVYFTDANLNSYTEQVLPMTIYYVGRNQLPELLKYMKEPGLYPMLRFAVTIAVSFIAVHENKRRTEVIEWYRDLIAFYMHHLHDPLHFDCIQVSMMITDLCDIQAKELLPEIIKLYETGELDVNWTGELDDIIEDIKADKPQYSYNYNLKTIQERYEILRR